MKKRVFLWILSLFVVFACSQTPEEKGTGYLTLNISQGTGTKADVDITDFILRISDGQVEVRKGRIADLPSEIPLPAGTYTIEAYSMEFDQPKFDEPFYSGKITVEIIAGETNEVVLVCTQGNAGIKVVWASAFSSLYDSYQAEIHCDEGYLNYMPNETRTGYFLPGTVSIIILADGQRINGGTITLAASDMVTLHLQPKYLPSGDLIITIIIDDTVNPRELELLVDPDDIINSETHPYNIEQAIKRQNETGVWVTGYIVGAKPSSGYDFVNEETWQATNIILADNIAETDDLKCIFVELGATTTIYRTNLNLVDYPDNLYRKVLLRGNLLLYQSRAGLRNLSGGFSFPEEYEN